MTVGPMAALLVTDATEFAVGSQTGSSLPYTIGISVLDFVGYTVV